MNKKNKLIAVYGSLRKGMGNNRCIDGAKMLSEEVVEIPFDMMDLGAFPGLIKSEQANPVMIEVYEVDDHTYARVERLEGYPSFYNRMPIQTSVGDADIYFLEGSRSGGRTAVEKTENVYDWTKYLGSRSHKRW